MSRRNKPIQPIARPVASKRLWVLVLLAIIGFTSYRIGLWIWGDRQWQAAVAALADRKLPDARQALERCRWLWPDNAELDLLAARIARREGQLADAERLLSRCSRHPKTQDAARFELRLVRLQAGDFRGTEDLDRFRREHPDQPEAPQIAEAQIAGSLATLQPDRVLELADWWERHRTSRADRVQGLIWRANTYLLVEDQAQARDLCREAIALDPQHDGARLMLVRLLVNREPKEAQDHLQMLLRRDPGAPQLLYHQALIDRNLGRLADARRALEQVLLQRPDWVEALVERARVELDAGAVAAAAPWLDRAERLSPKHRAVLLARIEFARRTGQQSELERYQQTMKTVEQEARERLAMALNSLRRSQMRGAADE